MRCSLSLAVISDGANFELCKNVERLFDAVRIFTHQNDARQAKRTRSRAAPQTCRVNADS